MRVLVTGSREWADRQTVWAAFEELLTEKPLREKLVIVHGASTSQDRTADVAYWDDDDQGGTDQGEEPWLRPATRPTRRAALRSSLATPPPRDQTAPIGSLR